MMMNERVTAPVVKTTDYYVSYQWLRLFCKHNVILKNNYVRNLTIQNILLS